MSKALADLLADDFPFLVFDRSMRRVDQDGRMHVAISNISKANVCPYKGSEIPGWQKLGLESDRIYKMLRSPDELAKPETVQSANNIQLMSSHVAVNAKDPKEKQVAGSLGTDAEFVPPYLRNSLVIWRQEDIDDVEARDRCELSCAYHYRPDMTSGIYEGEEYDGVMRDIRFNHCALVEEGRAGHDVIVADSKEQITMNHAALATRALSIGALVGFLNANKLAQDTKLDGVSMAFDGIPVGKKFDSRKLAKQLKPLIKGKLAADASMGQIAELLDMIDSHEKTVEGDESVSKEQHGAMEAAAHGQSNLGIPEKVGKEFADADKGKQFDAAEWMKGKGMSEDDVAEFEKLSKTQGAEDEDEETEEERAAREAKEAEDNEPDLEQETIDRARAKDKRARDTKGGAKDEPPPFPGKPKPGGGKDRKPGKDANMVSKGAMDAALKLAREQTTRDVLKTQRDLREALEEVRPIVGDVKLALDSAEQVYEHVLKAKGVALPEGEQLSIPMLKTMVGMLPKASDRRNGSRSESITMDAAAATTWEKENPHAAAIRIG